MSTNPENCLLMRLGKQFEDITVSIDGTEVQNAGTMKLSQAMMKLHVKEIVRKTSSKSQALKASTSDLYSC